MAQGCARIDSRLDTAEKVQPVASGSIAPGCLQLLGYEKRFHTAGTRSRLFGCSFRRAATSAQRVHSDEEPATRARRAPWGTKLLDGLERDCQMVLGDHPEQVRQQCRTAPQVALV